MVEKNEAVIDRCIESSVHLVHAADFGASAAGGSLEEMGEAAMPLLIQNPDFIAALAIRMALSWLRDRTRNSSSIVVGTTRVDWQIRLLKHEGFLAEVATVDDIAANCACVGFIAKESTPALVGAVELLRAGMETDDEMSVRPAIIVNGIPVKQPDFQYISCD